MDFESTLNFGKYKGKTVAEVFEIDAQYLEWAATKAQMLFFSNEDLRKISTKAQQEHDDWLRDEYPTHEIDY